MLRRPRVLRRRLRVGARSSVPGDPVGTVERCIRGTRRRRSARRRCWRLPAARGRPSDEAGAVRDQARHGLPGPGPAQREHGRGRSQRRGLQRDGPPRLGPPRRRPRPTPSFVGASLGGVNFTGAVAQGRRPHQDEPVLHQLHRRRPRRRRHDRRVHLQRRPSPTAARVGQLPDASSAGTLPPPPGTPTGPPQITVVPARTAGPLRQRRVRRRHRGRLRDPEHHAASSSSSTASASTAADRSRAASKRLPFVCDGKPHTIAACRRSARPACPA